MFRAVGAVIGLSAVLSVYAGSGLLTDARADVVPNPSQNYPPGAMPSVCDPAPTSDVCVNEAIRYLDLARAGLGQPPYALPADFTSLPPDDQALILTDLDRTMYGMRPLAGVTAALDADAQAGASALKDPVPSDPNIQSHGGELGIGEANLPEAYEELMYDDGPGSPNVDCAQNPAFCWGHRQQFFVGGTADASDPLAEGAAAPTGRKVTTILPVQGYSSYQPVFTYTWAQAQADGAGTNAYPPPPPVVPVDVEIQSDDLKTLITTPPGIAAVTSGGWLADCVLGATSGCGTSFATPEGVPVTFTASPGPATAQTGPATLVFNGWSGACSGKGPCVFTPGNGTRIVAHFGGSGDRSTGTPPAGTTAPSRAKVRGALRSLLATTRPHAKITSLLRAGGYTYAFQAPAAGSLTIDWYATTKQAKVATGRTAKRVLIGSGHEQIKRTGDSKVRLKLTSRGRATLRNHRLRSDSRLNVTVVASFTPVGQPRSSVTTSVKLPS